MLRSSLWLGLTLVASVAAAGTPEKDKGWDALIAEAVKRGGVETKLDLTTSYVFQHKEGYYITLTHALKTEKRFVCLVAKDQKSTVCVDWDTGKTTYSEKADAASPLKTRDATRIQDMELPGPFSGLGFALGEFMGIGPGRGHWVMRGNQVYYASPAIR